MLQVTTKLPIDNVLLLASLAYRSMPVPPTFGSAQLKTSTPLDWLVTLLVFEAEALLRRGLRQGYVEVRDELPYIRGRILFTDQMRGFSNPGVAACEFSDLIFDTAENRVLRSTLEALAIAPVHPALRLKALELTTFLATVKAVQLTHALFQRVRLTRLTAQYRPALELCRLWFDRGGVEHAAGEVEAPAFFFPMEKVFEAGVTNYLGTHLPRVRSQVGRSLTPEGSTSRRFSFTPDVVIGDPPSVVVDTKYARAEFKNRYGGMSFHNDDGYQIAFYAQALGCPGILVYPRDDADVDATFQNRGVRFTFLTVDLRKPGVIALDGLVNRVRDSLEEAALV
jgi:5-methylcytosine-specific restriction enzyme subunit McrC